VKLDVNVVIITFIKYFSLYSSLHKEENFVVTRGCTQNSSTFASLVNLERTCFCDALYEHDTTGSGNMATLRALKLRTSMESVITL
jgi:hypothetical protein